MHILSTFDVITLLSTTHSSSLRCFPVPLVTTGIYIYIQLRGRPPIWRMQALCLFSRLRPHFPHELHCFCYLWVTLGTLEHHLGNFGGPWVITRSKLLEVTVPTCPFWVPFGGTVSSVLASIVPKRQTQKRSHKQNQILFNSGSIFVAPNPCFWSSRLHGSTISKK